MSIVAYKFVCVRINSNIVFVWKTLVLLQIDYTIWRIIYSAVCLPVFEVVAAGLLSTLEVCLLNERFAIHIPLELINLVD